MANTIRAKSWYRKAWPAYTEDGGPALIKHKVVAAAEVIYKGDFVYLFTDNTVKYAGAGVAFVYGVALEDGVIGSPLAIAVANDGTIFIIQNKAGVASSTAVPGFTGDLFITGSGATRIPQLQAVTPVDNIFYIVERVPGDDTADTTNPGRLFVKAIKSQYTGR